MSQPDCYELLRPYQREGVRFLLEQDSALLADEMGLGKTVQVIVALSLLLRTPGFNRVLIVVPSSLSLNWERELLRWAPSVACRRVQGDQEDRSAYYRLPIHVLIVTYEQIRVDSLRSSYGDVTFDLVILDEAQRIKNIDSATSLACRLIPRRKSWALTGTPVENKIDDLISIFTFIRPGLLASSMSLDHLQQAMVPHFMRRKKDEVAKDLPPLLVQDLWLELTLPQREAYDLLWESRRRYGSYADLLALITRLKQICNYDPQSSSSSKLEALSVLVDGLSRSDDKIIVFSQYVETLLWLEKKISDSVRCLVFHGGLDSAERDLVVSAFRSDPGPSVLLMSLRAGGVGLNIQEAKAVVLFDRWWNPAMEAQAMNRAHRLNRERPLQVIRYLIDNSIEVRIAEVLLRKEALFDAYVDSAPVNRTEPLSVQELMWILDLDKDERNPGGMLNE